MSEEFDFDQYKQDMEETRKVLREIIRTMDTDGAYNPFNKHAPFLAKIVHEVREKLTEVTKP